MKPRDRSSPSGFTLIEVLTVLAISAILITIAVPSYHYAVCRARRAEGRVALMKLMQQQEQIYTQRTSYVAFSAASSHPDQQGFKWFSADTAPTSAYEIEASACEAMRISECVVLSARPGTERVNRSYADPHCGVLRLDSFGRKSAASGDCW